MTFFDSIKTVFRKYAEFEGRASRPEFWWFALFSFLVSAALNSLSRATAGFNLTLSPVTFDASTSLAGVWGIVVLLPTLAVTVRRLRDAGYGWPHVFWILVPIAGLVVLIVLLAQPGKGVAPVDAPPHASVESPQTS